MPTDRPHMQPLRIDPTRFDLDDTTGFYIRALDDAGRWHNVDIATLDRESLIRWVDQLGPSSHVSPLVSRLLGHPDE